jgi:hypothetical protein
MGVAVLGIFAVAKAEQAAQKVILEAERKAARDTRYAGSKARQR